MTGVAADTRYLAAVESVYAAASDLARWPEALVGIAAVFDDVGAMLVYQRADGSMGTIISPSMAEAQADYEKNWSRRDIRMIRGMERGYTESRDTVTDRHLVSEEEIAEHPLYTEFLAKHGLKWFAGSMISPDPRVTVALSVLRAPDRPPFSDDELATLDQMARHVENALRLGVRLLNAEVGEAAASDALHRLGVAVFRLDRGGRVISSNPAARALLGGPLLLVNERLSAEGQAEREMLADAIAGAVTAGDWAAHSRPRPVLLRDAAGEGYLAVYVLPVPAGAHRPFGHLFVDTAAIALVAGSKVAEPDPALVRDLLGLTLGEARVATLVGGGLPPKAAAERLGITEETARTVLKRVFAKTGVARQSELAGLLSRLIVVGAGGN